MTAPILEPGEIARLERLALTPDRRVAASGSGPHRSLLRGRSLDVVDWRDYQPGDDPRTIDVQAWARLDQVLVRLYEADVDLRVQLIVDTSASMEVGDKLRHAVRIAGAIGVAALTRNESLSVTSLSEPVPRRYRGRSSVGVFLNHLAAWVAEGPTPFVDTAKRLTATTSRPGLVVVVSDFLSAESTAFIDRLAARRAQILAVLVASSEDEDPDVLGEVQLVDAETQHRVDVDLSPMVIEKFRERRARDRAVLAQRLARHGSRLVVSWTGDDLMTQVVPDLSNAGVLR